MKDIMDIKPLYGFGSLKFGATQKDVEEVLGSPQETETIDVEGEIHEVEVWSYYELGHAVYFEKELNNVVTNFETDNAEATMFSQKVFELDQNGIIDLMKKNGFEDHEVEDDPELDERIVFFNDAHMQFVFDNGRLGLVSWAVAMDEDENIRWP